VQLDEEEKEIGPTKLQRKREKKMKEKMEADAEREKKINSTSKKSPKFPFEVDMSDHCETPM
jgi:hypothetical protein